MWKVTMVLFLVLSPLSYVYGIEFTDIPAGPTPCAFGRVDQMGLFLLSLDRLDRAGSQTEMASRAILVNGVGDEIFADSCRTAMVFDMLQILLAKIVKR
jgi:hypothetical protein